MIDGGKSVSVSRRSSKPTAWGKCARVENRLIFDSRQNGEKSSGHPVRTPVHTYVHGRKSLPGIRRWGIAYFTVNFTSVFPEWNAFLLAFRLAPYYG